MRLLLYFVVVIKLLLGRDSLLKDLESYMDGDSPVPMILIGFPGAGKSAVMATLARRSLEKNNYHVKILFLNNLRI